MHIAIDTTPLQSGHAGRGIGVYTRLLVESLHKLQSSHTISTFAPRDGIPHNADIVHYPYFDPFFLTLPRRSRVPFVVTVHDLIPIVFPKHFPRGVRGEVKWQMQRYRLRRAAHIITDSRRSARDVARFVRFPKEKIAAIYLAPDPQLQRVETRLSGLPETYFLYVGDVNWNKNITGLLDAFAHVVNKKKSAHLVLVGDAFGRQDIPESRSIASQIVRLDLTKRVHLVGRLTGMQLSMVYSHAIATILPSWYEGFGFPPLESFACGTPVVAAIGSSLDEIAGPALRVNPADTKSIADGMIRAMSIPLAKRQKLIDQGTAWVANFSWEKTAKQTLAVYEETLSHHTRI